MRTRGFGRRKSDRVKLGIGIGIGLLLAGIVLSKVGCDGTATTPTEVVATPKASGTVSPGNTVGTPTAVDPAPGANGPFDVTFGAGSCFTVKNNGSATAALESWYSGFDDQNQVIDKKAHSVSVGATASRCFAKGCIQVDIDHPGVKLVAGGFFDKDQLPFIPSKEPAKVAACRTTPCVEKWTREEESEVTYGEWGSCQTVASVDDIEGATVSQCQKKRTRTEQSFERSSCTKERRKVGEPVTTWEYQPCTCPCQNVTRGYVHVVADTHESGSYFYRVCTALDSHKDCTGSSIVWSDWLSKSATKDFEYAPNGKTLWVQLNTDSRDNGESNPDGQWEDATEKAVATCPQTQALWNEGISYYCKTTCEAPK